MANWGSCLMCGTPLIGRRADAVTCSNKCRQQAKRLADHTLEELEIGLHAIQTLARHPYILEHRDQPLDLLRAIISDIEQLIKSQAPLEARKLTFLARLSRDTHDSHANGSPSLSRDKNKRCTDGKRDQKPVTSNFVKRDQKPVTDDIWLDPPRGDHG